MDFLDKEELRKIQARYSHLRFMQYVWQDVSEPMQVGIHTWEMCRQLDIAVENFKKGISTFLVVKMPFRHGKSHILSRHAPAHFLGEFPDKTVMVCGYASDLAEGFSQYNRELIKTDEYKELYPEIEIDKKNGGVKKWGIAGHLGIFTASGLTSGITGKGYHLGILDDYCADRQDAESEVMRNKSWESFTGSFLTRRAPVSITIVLATQWHVDDIIGRIERKIDPENDDFDKDFPPFKILSFPAINGEVEVGEDNTTFCKTRKIKYEYLFPERFSPDWYKQQFASLGEYQASGLLMCNPTTRGGNIIDTSKIQWHDSLADFPATRYDRIWDLAHSEKQRIKDDPDWTSGTLIGFRKINGMWEVWIKDVARIRGKAPERDNFIRACADKDGQGVAIAVENSLDSKDAVNTLRTILSGRRSVIGIPIKGDKVARMSPLEPVFEAGNVHCLRGAWNYDWLSEVKEFPNGKHDDQVDNMSAGYILRCQSSGSIYTSRVSGV